MERQTTDERITDERIYATEVRDNMGKVRDPMANQASREMTVAEFLDSKIKDHQSRISSLKDLRDNLPVSFLTSGCHRVMAVFKYLN